MRHSRLSLNIIAFVMGAVLCLPLGSSYAQRGGNPIIIRDSEIEQTLESWMIPLLKSAGMGQNSVNLVLVQSSDMNAFVAGGANMFLYTGLINKTETPEELIGVMAHELGHIAGGHLIRTKDAATRASYESILGMVLGAAAALATGDGGAANAVIAGSSSMAQRRFLSHSRVQESSADQAALRFMTQGNINPVGLKTFMQKLENEELLPLDQQSEYIRTHPLTQNRIETLKSSIERASYTASATPAQWIRDHERMRAKLIGFIEPGRVPWVYNDRDVSIPAQYARTIAAYRQNKPDIAVRGIDALISAEPSNPYFQELKGQMLVDFGRIDQALPYYKTAVAALPDAGLIRIAYAHALMESASDPDYNAVIDHLDRALRHEPRSARAHRLLATAYGRTGRDGMAKLHLAEEAVLQRRFDYARRQAETALRDFKNGSREWIQAKDVLRQVDQLDDKKG